MVLRPPRTREPIAAKPGGKGGAWPRRGARQAQRPGGRIHPVSLQRHPKRKRRLRPPPLSRARNVSCGPTRPSLENLTVAFGCPSASPFLGDWSSKVVNQLKGDGSSRSPPVSVCLALRGSDAAGALRDLVAPEPLRRPRRHPSFLPPPCPSGLWRFICGSQNLGSVTPWSSFFGSTSVVRSAKKTELSSWRLRTRFTTSRRVWSSRFIYGSGSCATACALNPSNADRVLAGSHRCAWQDSNLRPAD